MLLINNDFTALLFSGIEFLVSDGSLKHVPDCYSEPQIIPVCEQIDSLRVL